ncbi:hypothetical protein B0H13DRAFT_2342516 [Mycena leptocephala]|nr:hypothetical protein B0H13DRAFT_2342516 [Mycena leptocephala]
MTHTMCGTCRRLTLDENGQEDPHAAARQFRFERLQRSMAGPLQNVGNQQFGASTSIQELEHLKNSNQKGLWTLIVHPHRGACLIPFIEVKTKIIAQYDNQWTSMKDHPLSLKLNECSLRFSGNIDMDPATHDMTIQNVYGFYQGRPDRAVVNVDAKLKLPKGISMVFELYINEKLYKDRVLEMMDDDDDSIGGKRKKPSSSRQLVSKRPKTAGTLTSTFNPDDDYSVITKGPVTVKVTFTAVHCKPEGTEGKHVLTKDNVSRTGAIEVNTLILSSGNRGKSKDVYKFKIDGDAQPYVAKKVFDVGNGCGVEVTPSVNKSILSHDLVRLKRLSWFHRAFLKRASEKGLDELADFAVSDAFMILVQRATAASAVSEVEDASEVESYLVEPLRATSVVNKFTRTFGASQDTDKLTFTILAFHHFIMHETACLLAFADIQGSRDKGQGKEAPCEDD